MAKEKKMLTSRLSTYPLQLLLKEPTHLPPASLRARFPAKVLYMIGHFG